ncbi:MAG: hypothetical protein NZ551_09130 [Microscillaceae bacterium]|nr:hypothetical protein [Microscillaceae bacterium]MDW8461362.1 hypothetical protein [Cytophagales bacterium]
MTLHFYITSIFIAFTLLRSCFLLVVLLCIIALHRYSQTCGIGLTYDSLNYLHASQTWLTKERLLNQDGTLFLQQPPLFPIILSFFSPYQQVISSWANTFCLVITVFFWFWIGKSYIYDIKWLSLYLWLLVWATPLFLVHQFLWSEPIYLFISSLAFVALYQYEQKRTLIWLFCIIFCLLLLPLQRIVGIALSVAVLIVIGLDKRNSISIKIALLVISILPIGTWLSVVYAYRTPQEFVATYGMQTNFGEGIIVYANSLSLWFLPNFLPTWLRMCSLFLFFLFWFHLPQNRFSYMVLIYFLAYTVILLIKKSDFWDTERFVALLYPCFLWLTFTGIANLKKQCLWLFAVACLLCVYPTLRCAKNILFWKEAQCKKIDKN